MYIFNSHIIMLYIDPGTGSLLFQALLSGFLTVVVFFKKIVAFIKIKFGPKKHKNHLKDQNHNEPS